MFCLSLCQYKKYKLLAKHVKNKNMWNTIANQVPEALWLHLEFGHRGLALLVLAELGS